MYHCGSTSLALQGQDGTTRLPTLGTELALGVLAAIVWIGIFPLQLALALGVSA
jgi:hypothetical protein